MRLIGRRTIEKERIVTDCRWVNHHTYSAVQNRTCVSFSDKSPDTFNKAIRKIVRTGTLTKLVDHISIELWMSYTVLQKGFKISVVFLQQVTITFIKLCKELTKFMKPVTLLKKFARDLLIALIEIFNIAASSREANEL